MLKDFVIIQGMRIRKSVIKFYEPIDAYQLLVHYNVPRTEKRIFTYETAGELADVVAELDAML